MTDAKKNQAPPDESITPEERKRDPEDREVHRARIRELREKMMDKTLADSYPASDPPSSIPNPCEEDSLKCETPAPSAGKTEEQKKKEQKDKAA